VRHPIEIFADCYRKVPAVGRAGEIDAEN